MTASEASVSVGQPETIDRSTAVRMIVSAAWASVLLGLLAELLVVIALAATGEQLGGAKKLVNDTIKSITWPLVVCVGIAAGKAAAKLWAVSLESRIMGLAGAASAIIGQTAARLVHRSVGEALSLSPAQITASLFAALVVVKAGQYGFIGTKLGNLSVRRFAGWMAHVEVGLVADGIFGVTALVLFGIFKEMSTIDWISNGINELLVPVGCSFIVYISERIARTAAG